MTSAAAVPAVHGFPAVLPRSCWRPFSCSLPRCLVPAVTSVTSVPALADVYSTVYVRDVPVISAAVDPVVAYVLAVIALSPCYCLFLIAGFIFAVAGIVLGVLAVAGLPAIAVVPSVAFVPSIACVPISRPLS